MLTLFLRAKPQKNFASLQTLSMDHFQMDVGLNRKNFLQFKERPHYVKI